MSYAARVLISSPQKKARRLLEAAEAGERENIDHLQALDRACVHVLGTHDQAIVYFPLCRSNREALAKIFAIVLKC